jgi:hypothetical protein
MRKGDSVIFRLGGRDRAGTVDAVHSSGAIVIRYAGSHRVTRTPDRVQLKPASAPLPVEAVAVSSVEVTTAADEVSTTDAVLIGSVGVPTDDVDIVETAPAKPPRAKRAKKKATE